jgi:hypothetical protein
MPKRGKTTVVMADIASILAELKEEEFKIAEEVSVPFISDLLKRQLEARGEKPTPDQLMLLARDFSARLDRPGIAQWDAVSKLLPDLIRMAKIPMERQVDFCLAVQRRLRWNRFDASHRSHWSWMRTESVLEVEQRLRAAQDAIMALSERQRHQIGHRLDPRRPDHWVTWIPNVLETLDRLTEGLVKAAEGPGRPKLQRNLELHPFIIDIWSIARECGGDFKLSQLGGEPRGSIVEALNLLRQVLPPGFVPNVPAYTMFRNLKKEVRPRAPAESQTEP